MKSCNKIILILLVIPVIVSAKNYKGAEYRTFESFLYGRFEVSLKTAGKEGMLASFFTYHELGSGGTAEWNEIDIEIMGRYNNSVQFNTITPGQTNHVRSHYVNFDPSVDFHTYAFEWTPDYVAWFIDGEEVYRQTGDHIKTLNRSQKIMMNVWNPAYINWAGTWNDAILPAFSFYDWVAYYSYSPGNGSYGSGNNFQFKWRDEFDSWNTSKWTKAVHTWEGNNCDFVWDNAVFNDGKLVLCLTDQDNLGFTDKKSPVLLWVRGSGNKIRAFFSEQIETSSAENLDNYLIPGYTISKAELLKDLRTVELSVSNLSPDSSPNLIIKGGIKDRAAVPNTLTLVAKIVLVLMNPEFPYKINIGSTTTSGGYLKDQGWNSTVDYGYMDGSSGTNPNVISNTDEQKIYQSERYGLVKYFVRLPNDIYNIKLMFAENYFNASGRRIFDVYVQGKLLINDLDLYSVAGDKSAYNIVCKEVEVTDGLLDIHFASEIENPLVNGISIEKSSSTDAGYGYEVPSDFFIEQNYPNPFNPTTKINYHLPITENIKLRVYDLLGQEVATLVDEQKPPGKYSVDFDGSGMSSGVYFYKFYFNGSSLSRKMILIK
jgi:hypothetical protein